MLTLILAGALAAGPTMAEAERAFLAFRDAEDLVRLKATQHRETRRHVRIAEALAVLGRVNPSGLSEEDRRAVAVMRQALVPPREGVDPLTRSVYAAYTRAAEAVAWDGQVIDRLTVLGRLASEPDRERRKSLFAALGPVWASVAGPPGGPSPYAQLVAQRRTAWSKQADGSPFARKAAEWGLTEGQLEGWLVRVLEAWRDAAVTGPPIEPWDWYFANGAADRAMASPLPRDAMIACAIRYAGDLGASPERLRVALDLKPRRGKDPVAVTDFVRHGRYAGTTWRDGRFRISASYREGGLGNLYELMHEMGHAVHIAAIRQRPAFDDWPDSDVLTEALADMLGVEAYELPWQARYIGETADAAASQRARLSGAMLDVAWALFEMRVHRDPSTDPNVVWAEITSRYLGIAPHPELPWWALRGQLVDAPGYMTNYALGTILTEALRARVRALRGENAFETPSPELYRWLSERLYRFGLARTSRNVVEAFLEGPVTAEPLLTAIAAVRLGS